MQYHTITSNPNIVLILLKIDRDLYAEYTKHGCLFCKHTVHSANYPRKTGIDIPIFKKNETNGALIMYSGCCSACRKRHTGPSIRFAGAKRCISLLFILICAVNNGLNAERQKKLQDIFHVSRQTLTRWIKWWRTAFLSSSVWKTWSGYIPISLNTKNIPRELLKKFFYSTADPMQAALRVCALIVTKLDPLSVITIIDNHFKG